MYSGFAFDPCWRIWGDIVRDLIPMATPPPPRTGFHFAPGFTVGPTAKSFGLDIDLLVATEIDLLACNRLKCPIARGPEVEDLSCPDVSGLRRRVFFFKHAAPDAQHEKKSLWKAASNSRPSRDLGSLRPPNCFSGDIARCVLSVHSSVGYAHSNLGCRHPLEKNIP